MNIYTVIGKCNNMKISIENVYAENDKDARLVSICMPVNFKVSEVKLTGTKEN